MWGCACAAAVAMTRPANAAAAQKKKRQIIDLLANAAPACATNSSRAGARYHGLRRNGGVKWHCADIRKEREIYAPAAPAFERKTRAPILHQHAGPRQHHAGAEFPVGRLHVGDDEA